MPGLVANVAFVNAETAALLADGFLALLHVDLTAVSSIVSSVVGQASIPIDYGIPLLLVAVAGAIGKPVGSFILPADTRNPTDAFQGIIAQGSSVVKEILAAPSSEQTLLAHDLMNEVARIVSDTSSEIGEPICSVCLEEAGQRLEMLLPCASVGAAFTSPLVSALNPTGTQSQEREPLTGSSEVIPDATTAGNGVPSDVTSVTQEPMITSIYRSDFPAASPSTPETAALQTMHCSQGSTASVSPSTTSICRDCDLPSACPAPLPSQTADSCPGESFECKECLNGRFCPPQETPPQVVPCGLGWPCFHCVSGYFCSSTVALPAAPTVYTPGVSATSASVEPKPTSHPQLNYNTDTGVPGWSYLGCFQDNIIRTLSGSKPLDYLRGAMSRSICISHCLNGGYLFAGTEYGLECWCGSAIRDDAVRLPEDSCNMLCQESGNEICGGSWVISVYRNSAESVQPNHDGEDRAPLPETQLSYSFPQSSVRATVAPDDHSTVILSPYAPSIASTAPTPTPAPASASPDAPATSASQYGSLLYSPADARRSLGERRRAI